MKILLLNPHIDASHEVARTLELQGVALLITDTPDEAWQILQLHGNTVDLAVIHREGLSGNEESGFDLLKRIKADSSQQDLPVIASSEKWADAQFAEHQSSSVGANAYLRHPFTGNQLVELIHAVVGWDPPYREAAPELPSLSNEVQAPPVPSMQAPPPPPLEATQGTINIPNFVTEGNSVREPGTIAIDPESVQKMQSSAPAEISIVATIEELGQRIQSHQESLVPPPPPSAIENEPTFVGMSEPEQAAVQPVSFSEPSEPALDLKSEMPYLYDRDRVTSVMNAPSLASGANTSSTSHAAPISIASVSFTSPLGDAVVPGGAAQSPDSETLKKYLLLREQDVVALSAQLKSTRDQLNTVEESLRQERAKSTELEHVCSDQKRKIKDFDRDKALALEAVQTEVNELKFELKSKADKARLLEVQVREASEELERIKERVRGDIRKIRVREKELENRLEIMKKDSEALIGARENKIVELKRKLDLLEFNMDLLQNKYAREKEVAVVLRDKLAKASQAVRVAGGLLDEPNQAVAERDLVKKIS